MFREVMSQAGEDVLRHLGEDVTTDSGAVTAIVVTADEDARLSRTGSSSTDHGLDTNLRQAKVIIRESEADNMPPGARVTLRGEDYEALEARPHGYAMVEVPLVDAQPSEPEGAVWR